MNVALIIAGGSGHRMGQDIPKQFINVYDKPVLSYTLEGFQKHPLIDAIELVCIDGWHDVVWAYAKQFGIDKLKWIVPGGNSGQVQGFFAQPHRAERLCPGQVFFQFILRQLCLGAQRARRKQSHGVLLPAQAAARAHGFIVSQRRPLRKAKTGSPPKNSQTGRPRSPGSLPVS